MHARNMAAKKAFVQSVDRALQILELFADKSSMSLIEISEAMDLAKTTVFGLIATLEKRCFLEQDSLTGRYRLGYRFVELSQVLRHRTDLIQEALRLLRPIAEKNGHNAHITTRNGLSVTYIGQVIPESSVISINTVLGSHAPANCTSTGKAFLAMLSDSELDALYAKTKPAQVTPKSISDLALLKQHLHHVRERGYATDENESISGVSGVGVIVCNQNGAPVIGISVAGLSIDFNEEILCEYGSILKQIAKQLQPLTELSGTSYLSYNPG